MKKIESAPKEILEIDDFGVTVSDMGVQLKVWAPCAIRVKAAIYDESDDLFRSEILMNPVGSGVFELVLSHDYLNKYYTYIITSAETDYEVVDPYAVASGVNSEKAMIVDLSETNPQGWEEHDTPQPVDQNEAVVYELHVRDFSIDENSGMKNRGKYIAFTEFGTRIDGIKTGVDHLKDLGITHVHLLPVYDFKTVDEEREGGYNWGYDPALYNVPEGSYSTDAYDGRVRIIELKKCIMALHKAGIRVILDVVYNHTYESLHSSFNRLAPGYFYRLDDGGHFTNGSGCGNELATEHTIVRKFIIDSLKHWVQEYRVDGFRFDLLGLYDKETVRRIVHELKEMRPDLVLYGEPWIGWESGLAEKDRFLKTAQQGLDIGLFNDDFRNAIKGDNDGTGSGFVMERLDTKPWVELGIAASTKLPDGRVGFADRAIEVVNYVSAHDNLILWDKIEKTMPSYDYESKIKMHKLALSIVLTSFGMAFIQAGTEFVRTKHGHDNSYNAGDDVNKIDWSLKIKNADHCEYIKNLIAYRTRSGFFKWNDMEDIQNHLRFIQAPEGAIVYTISNGEGKDCIVIHNGTKMRRPIFLPEGVFTLIADHDHVYLENGRQYSTRGERPVHVEGFATMILEGHIDQVNSLEVRPLQKKKHPKVDVDLK